MARKQKNYVDYFPHDTHQSKAVRTISKTYGNDGYAFYYKLRELLGRTDNYNYDLSEQIDWFDFLGEMAIKEEQARELIEFLVIIGELDKELWSEEKRLWSNSLIEDISDVYDKRVAEIPDKYSFRDGNTQSKVKDSKAKNSKEEKTIEEESGSTHGGVDLERLKDKYKNVDIDLDKSYKKFRLHQQSSNRKYADENAGFEYWVVNDIENGRHHKELTEEERRKDLEERLKARRAFRN